MCQKNVHDEWSTGPSTESEHAATSHCIASSSSQPEEDRGTTGGSERVQPLSIIPSRQIAPLTEDEWFDLSGAFASMYSKIVPLLQNRIAVSDLKRYLRFYCHPIKGLPYVDSSLYQHLSSTEDIIDNLCEKRRFYCIDVGLLGNIVESFGCDECKHLFQEYIRRFRKTTSLKRSRNELSDDEIDSCPCTKRLNVKIEGDSVTVNVVEQVKEGLEKSSGVNRNVITYAKHGTGCVLLTFLVPETMVEAFTDISGSPEHWSDLAAIGILSIEVEEVTISTKAQLIQDKMKQLPLAEVSAHPSKDEALSSAAGGSHSEAVEDITSGHTVSSYKFSRHADIKNLPYCKYVTCCA